MRKKPQSIYNFVCGRIDARNRTGGAAQRVMISFYSGELPLERDQGFRIQRVDVDRQRMVEAKLTV